jgi:hypothetical protein
MSADKQNRLVTDQLGVMHESLQFELRRARLASRPVLLWTEGGTNDQSTKTCPFDNDGGRVRKLAASTTADVEITISPKDVLHPGAMGSVEFRSRAGRLPIPFDFSIECTTELAESFSKTFRVAELGGKPVDVA